MQSGGLATGWIFERMKLAWGGSVTESLSIHVQSCPCVTEVSASDKFSLVSFTSPGWAVAIMKQKQSLSPPITSLFPHYVPSPYYVSPRIMPRTVSPYSGILPTEYLTVNPPGQVDTRPAALT